MKTSLQENISRIKELMLLKEYPQVVDTYSNIKFQDFVVGKSQPSRDSINPALLQDVDTAAKNAGVEVSVTTAVSGHYSTPSRHPDGNAVDIAIINGKSVSKSNREDADKFVNALVDMGYIKNKESGNDKAVLTFGFPKHDNHVHVSNKSSSSSIAPTKPPIKIDYDELQSVFKDDKVDSEEALDLSKFFPSVSGDTSTSFYQDFMMNYLKKMFPNITENYSSFGKQVEYFDKYVLIPYGPNTKIKSPVSGYRKERVSRLSCTNQITIEHKVDGNKFYLVYCGVSEILLRPNESVEVGDTIAKMDSKVKVYIYNQSGAEQYIDSMLKQAPEEPEQRGELRVSPIENTPKQLRVNPITDTPKSLRVNPITDTPKSLRVNPIQNKPQELRVNPIKDY